MQKLTKNTRVVVLTGAGISAESGLKTFRDKDGLWENHPVEEVATPEAFSSHPELVYRFYNQRRAQLLDSNLNPNEGHRALASLEEYLQDNLLVVTQNVDNLHERAGTKRLIHMHGDLLSYRCCSSGRVVTTIEDYDQSSRCHCCQPSHAIRPNIVWFGEMPMQMDRIYQRLAEAELFIAIGTSGQVYPAAGFVQEAKLNGAFCVELNLQPSVGHSTFDEAHYGLGSKIIPLYIQGLLN
ncbi:Sir2 family NAD+-dependent deacetylase [Aliiglaciecola sp. LCG003]|uniref:Sir2 family NAD+-dependent deacetylase n=1 Tax=Aliiglaciecola sp. LCG003 TaxID=3053655 RepID=UPI0025733BD2|nr:Sir2 family NAD+-dependent deacetylase [Aliiglaciecola sp. LCG003]WJG07593.1 NAD-dependent protein deacylase [Aliiglaciecola sp. LCG003]